MAGGSQIIINKDGITIITPAKFEAKAGQHLFKKGSKVNFSLPEIPNVLLPYSNKLGWCIKKYAKKKQVEF